MKLYGYCFLFISCYVIGSTDLNEHNYDPMYHMIATQLQHKTAIIAIGYNRPTYFKQVIESLEKNPESQILPFFFILDGGKNSTQKENIRIIENSTIAHKYIIARPYNYGLSKNIIDARRFIFDWCGFDRVIIFEDDLVVSADYIGITLRLHDWARTNYDNIGVVQGWNFCTLDTEQKVPKQNHVRETYAHWWGYCIDKTVWDAIKPTLFEYEQTFLGKRIQSARAIRNWLQKQLDEVPERSYEKTFPSHINYKRVFSSKFLATGQDSMTAFSLYKAGYIRVATVVNRGLYIGKCGQHSRPEQWKRMGFGNIKLDVLSGDAMIIEFVKG